MILKKIYRNKRGGYLRHQIKNHRRELVFSNGKIINARSNFLGEGLPRFLLKRHLIEMQKFLQLEYQLDRFRGKLSTYLVDNGYLKSHSVEQVLGDYFHRIAMKMFLAEKGEWESIKSEPEGDDFSGVQLDLAPILMRGVFKLKDLSCFREEKGRMAVTVNQPQKELFTRLKKPDQTLFEFLKKHPKSSVGETTAYLSYSANILWQKIYLFYLLGWLEFVSPQTMSEKDHLIETVNHLYKLIAQNNGNYYDLFGISEDTPPEGIRPAIIKLINTLNPAKINAIEDPDLRDKAQTILTAINNSSAILLNKSRRNSYDQRIKRPE